MLGKATSVPRGLGVPARHAALRPGRDPAYRQQEEEGGTGCQPSRHTTCALLHSSAASFLLHLSLLSVAEHFMRTVAAAAFMGVRGRVRGIRAHSRAARAMHSVSSCSLRLYRSSLLAPCGLTWLSTKGRAALPWRGKRLSSGLSLLGSIGGVEDETVLCCCTANIADAACCCELLFFLLPGRRYRVKNGGVAVAAVVLCSVS